MKTLEFIKTNKNWEELLTSKPYFLKIKTKDTRVCLMYNQIKSDMSNEIVQECRGLIIDTNDMRIVCYPFNKFFNYTDTLAATIDWKSAVMQKKIDGSIMKLYFYDNRWVIASNGTIEADTAPVLYPSENITTLLQMFMASENYKDIDFTTLNKNYTYMFELTGKQNRVVVPHTTISLTHIGTRDNTTYKEILVDINIKKPSVYNLSFKSAKSSIEQLSFREEGYVAVDKYFNRVKIKSLAYLAAHHLKDNVASEDKILALLISGEDREFLQYYPEYTSDFETINKKYIAHLSKLDELVNIVVDLKAKKLTRKEEALFITKYNKDCHKYMFALLDNKSKTLDMLKDRLTVKTLLN